MKEKYKYSYIKSKNKIANAIDCDTKREYLCTQTVFAIYARLESDQ